MTSEFPIEKREVTHFIVVDIETTGPNCLKHSMIEFAATFWAVGGLNPIGTLDFMLGQPSDVEWCERTLNEVWNSPKNVMDNTTLLQRLEKRLSETPLFEPEDAMRAFVKWCIAVEDSMESDERVVFISDTNSFDTTFLNVYLCRFAPDAASGLDWIFGEYRPTFHIDAFYLGLGKTMRCWNTEQAALNFLKLEFPDWVTERKEDHTALNDCLSLGAKASFLISQTH